MEFDLNLDIKNQVVPEHTLLNFAENAGRIIPGSASHDAAISEDLQHTRDAFLHTAAVANVSSHRIAAYNALCALFTRCHAINKGLGDAIATEDAMYGMFELYLNRADVPRASSMRQRITALTSILQVRPEARKGLVRRIIGQAATIVVKRDYPIHIRPALFVLNLFITKGFSSSDEVLNIASEIERPSGALSSNNPAGALFEDLFECALFDDAVIMAGNLLTSLLGPKGLTSTWEGESVPAWVYPLEKIVQRSPSSVRPLSLYAFPAFVQGGPEQYLAALRYFGLDGLNGARSAGTPAAATQGAFEILCKLLQVGARLGVVEIIDSNEACTACLHNKAVRVPDAAIGTLLPDSRPTVRLAALSILIVAPSIVRPLTRGSLVQLRRNWDHLASDPSPSFRGDFLSFAQKLIDRVRASAFTLARTLRKHGTDESARSEYRDHVRFIKSLVDYVESCVSPCATYPRRITGLKLFQMLAGAGMYFPGYSSVRVHPELAWPCRSDVRPALLISRLQALVQDPFPDVRAESIAALQILATALSREPPSDGQLLQIHQLILLAEKKTLASGRADHADGLARLYGLALQRCFAQDSPDAAGIEQTLTARDNFDGPNWWMSRFGIVDRLCNQLEDSLVVLERSINEAVERAPVHGTLQGLQYVIRWMNTNAPQSPPTSAERAWWYKRNLGLVEALERLHHAVSDIVCNDAPEGHLPDSADESLDTKDVLSFSWRAIKESSQLMSALVINTRLRGFSRLSDSEWLSLVEWIGKLCQMQLLEIRHRGAFSAVSLALNDCCKQLSLSGQQSMLRDWYHNTFQTLHKKTSITRRSAGLPLIFVPLLTYGDTELFGEAVGELKELACSKLSSNQSIDDSSAQVHSLNCLRSIFKSAILSQRSEQYIEVGLQLATEVDASAWPIRNAALMLFQTLVDRLLGLDVIDSTGKSSSAMKFSYSKFPTILNTIIKIMEDNVTSANSSDSEGLFASLHILQRAPPTGLNRQSVFDLVEALSGSPNWHVRDMAARTYARVVDVQDVASALERLSDVDGHENLVGGRILCFQYLLKAPSFKRVDIGDLKLSRTIAQSTTKWSRAVKSPIAFAWLFNGLLALFELMLDSDRARNFREVYGELLITTAHLLKKSQHPLQGPFAQVAREAGLNFALLAYRAGLPHGSSAPLEEFLLKAVRTVEKDDQSACIAFIRKLELLQHTKSRQAIEGVCRVLARLILASPSPGITDITVYSLSEILPSSPTWKRSQFPLTREQTLGLLDKTLKEQARCRESTREVSNAWLRLWGQLLGWCLEEGLEVEHKRMHLMLLLGRIQISLKDENELPERLAACESIEGLGNFWSTVSDSQWTMNLLFALSDTLVDDDEGVRTQGAAIATRLLFSTQQAPARTESVIPSAAHEMLVHFMGAEYRHAPEFCGPAISRLIGRRGGDGRIEHDSFPSIRRILEEEEQKTAELFRVEEQNLYVDPVREARRWATVLGTVDSVDPSAAVALEEWVADSIHEMRESELVAKRSSSEGPAFTTGVLMAGEQLFLAAALAIKWRRRGEAIPWTRDVEGGLLDLCDWFVANQLGYEPWLRMIRQALQ